MKEIELQTENYSSNIFELKNENKCLKSQITNYEQDLIQLNNNLNEKIKELNKYCCMVEQLEDKIKC